jgi:hypothetical protein
MKIPVVIVLTSLVMACGSQPVKSDENGKMLQYILNKSDECIKEKSLRNENKSDCFYAMHRDIEINFSDKDNEKAPVLKAASRLYLLELQVENKKLSRDYARAELMAITNDLRVELREAEYRSAVLNAAEAQRQRQLFQAAQQLLTPQPSNVKTCTPQQGAPNGTFVCY